MKHSKIWFFCFALILLCVTSIIIAQNQIGTSTDVVIDYGILKPESDTTDKEVDQLLPLKPIGNSQYLFTEIVVDTICHKKYTEVFVIADDILLITIELKLDSITSEICHLEYCATRKNINSIQVNIKIDKYEGQILMLKQCQRQLIDVPLSIN